MSERRIASSSSRLHGDRNKLSSNLHGQNLETVLELDGETLESILKLVVGRLRDAIQSTVENIPSNEKQDRCFLSNGDLERIIDSRLLARLLKALVTDSNFVNFQEGGHEEPQRNNRDALIVNEVVDRYIAMTISRKKLLALVLYQESQELLVLFMQWLKYHGDDAPSDDSIPFSSVSLDHLGVLGRLQHNIICDQNIFTPITILQSEDLKIGTQDRLPFIAGKKDFTKFSSGTVCEVTIAQRHFAIKDGRRMMTANPDGAKAIALKLFNDKQHMDEVTISFQTELNILRDIRRFNMKQKAIMLDWGSLTVVDDVGNPISHYLMFESATFSLTGFLHSGACAQTWITGGRSLLLAKFGDIVDALAFLHDSLKTVHLDIKPDNIIISGHEASRSLSKAHNDNNLIWRLSNFGLARKLGASQRLGHNASKLLSDPSTVSDKQPVGTYQGPEIYEGELGRASYSSDVWSIGCVALQVLAFISGGPFEVSKLHDCLATEYFDRKGRLTLFYVRNDTHAWRNGDVSHYRYQYLKDYYPVTGQIPDTQVQAAVNPQVIHWSNKLHRSYEGYAEQRFIRQYLEQIFCSVLLINSSKRVGADHLSKALQVIQSRWKLFEDNPVDYFHYQRSIESSEISDTHKQSVPLVNTVEPSKPYRTRTVARRWRSSYKHVSIFDNATIRGPQISNLYPAIESNDATTARSELERDVGQLQRYCLGSSRYPVHCAIHLKAYEVLTVLLEFSDAETANLVCEGRTALELACDGGGDARALGVIKQYQHKFDFPGGVYERYRGALNTDVRNVLDDLFGTSSAGKEKEVSRPNDATSDIDQGLAPPSLQELSPPDKTSIDNKDSTSEAQVNTQLLQTEFIESFDKHGRSFASVNREVDSLPESSVKSSAPLTISKKGIIKPVNDELGGELIFQATQKNLSCLRQVKTSLPNFTLPPSLPLLVDKALRYLPIPHIEPSIPEEKIRVRWISGGRRRYDDFVEIGSGAAIALEKTLEKRYKSASQTSPGGDSGSGFIRFIFDVLQGRNRQDSRADTEQGPGEVELTDNVQNLSIDSGQIQASGITESEKTRLLLCIDDGRSKSILKQEVLENIKSDFELFDYLHKQYFTNYQWFTVRSIGMVSLAHFNVNLSNATTVFKHDDICKTTTHEHFDASTRGFCLCIPPAENVGPDKEYDCSPAPRVLLHPRVVPVLGPRMLTSDFLNPSSINQAQKTTLNQLPKRICGVLKATPEAQERGWGLHIEEDWHWPTLYCCFFVTCSFSLLFGIIWSVKRNDIQGAFAVSGYVLTLGAMFLGYMAIPKI